VGSYTDTYNSRTVVEMPVELEVPARVDLLWYDCSGDTLE
jgi:hypothetical protein